MKYSKREMMERYYEEVALHSAEISLKQGIEGGSIQLNGDEISGKTYDARLALKKYFNATWDGAKKVWKIRKEQAFAAIIFREGLTV